jgi:RNA-binding protein
LAQNLLILRADSEHTEIGTELIDAELTAVGTIVDVFGPVENPYIAVSPNDSVHPPSMLGEPVYAR